jgi:hypothetical protein
MMQLLTSQDSTPTTILLTTKAIGDMGCLQCGRALKLSSGDITRDDASDAMGCSPHVRFSWIQSQTCESRVRGAKLRFGEFPPAPDSAKGLPVQSGGFGWLNAPSVARN